MLNGTFAMPLRDFDLDVADFAVQEGETLALIGENGAGKSTVLRVLSGLLKPVSGRIVLNDRVLFDSAAGVCLAPEDRQIGYMFQNYALFPHMTARENIGYGLRVRGMPEAEVSARVDALCERMGVSEIADQLVTRMSGGQRQRTALARALAPSPELLLLDEPLSALDVRTQEQMRRELASVIRSERIPCIIVTHSIVDALAVADRIAVIEKGRIVACGAPEEILYVQKPHLGTDQLVKIVKNIRNYIQEHQGEVRFRSKVTEVLIEKGKVRGVVVNGQEEILSPFVVLALGHSARDTFFLLEKKNIHMEPKSFAVGLRAEHPQTLINQYQYGKEDPENLGAAAYKLTHRGKNGRGVYSFCMCPGGYVVNASSEPGRLAVNGMSYHDRDSQNANSALIVTVTPEDFQGEGPLAGVEFQRRLEEKAYKLGNGKIPLQLYGDYLRNQKSTSLGQVTPCMKGGWNFGNLRELFPEQINETLTEGIQAFGNIIPGFDRKDMVLSGVESRTSSPVRITRDESFQCNITGIYPCGEGAGYAGGITSAAMDGLKVGEAIVKKIRNLF